MKTWKKTHLHELNYYWCKLDVESLIRTQVPKPRELPQYGSGGLHSEQQFCYELGYREGAAALRKAMRKKLDSYVEGTK